MLQTFLKGLPYLRLKPAPAVPHGRRQPAALIVPSSTSVTSQISPSWPTATVADTPDDDTDDVQLQPPPAPALPSTPTPQPAHPPIDTPSNRFGVFRCYAAASRSDPEQGLTLDAFADAGTHRCAPPDPHERDSLRPFGNSVHAWLSQARDVVANSFAPSLNWSGFKLMEWQYTGSMTKPAGESQRIIDVVTNERFEMEDPIGFKITEAQRKLCEFRATTMRNLFSA